jgi:hypothetical protein
MGQLEFRGLPEGLRKKRKKSGVIDFGSRVQCEEFFDF